MIYVHCLQTPLNNPNIPFFYAFRPGTTDFRARAFKHSIPSSTCVVMSTLSFPPDFFFLGQAAMSTALPGWRNTIPSAVVLFYGTSLAGIEEMVLVDVWLSIVSAS